MLKKALPVCDNISRLLVTAESLLEGLSTRLVSAKERKKHQQRSQTESTFRKQSAKKGMIRKFFCHEVKKNFVKHAQRIHDQCMYSNIINDNKI